ncbi:iron-sulfur cluster assembly 2 homolog, mitochondrial [Anopheles darlingi]|uniref:iron-sulfur cluster assembly 2 homolog, mitochondrial n=1 Tax=Anopheles darlingi TaxID=43151 RepID=UPI0021001764|nr:iron-sulfur cluster assembly 2 homolog, mitochondrial [Anopheles darlingi]
MLSMLPKRLFASMPKISYHRRLVSSATVDNQVQLSDSCISRLKEICQNGSFLRVSVEGGGCSGFQYKFSIEKQLGDDDTVLGDGGARVAIDNVSVEYLSGATIDYHTELIRSGFRVINNPKAEQGCSCGASFAVKLD